MGGQSIVVQPFGGYQELQIQFCDQRGWGVSQQCNRRPTSTASTPATTRQTWKQPWLPVPVLGEVAGYDRPVQFDVYASTEQIYVFMDDKPAGCAVLPAGRMPAGDVTVAVPRRRSTTAASTRRSPPPTRATSTSATTASAHSDRHLDDFGIDLSTRGARRGTRRCCPAGRVVWRLVSSGGARARRRRSLAPR